MNRLFCKYELMQAMEHTVNQPCANAIERMLRMEEGRAELTIDNS